MARLTLRASEQFTSMYSDSDCCLPGLFFVPVKWNPNFVSWSPLESLQRRGAGMWVMARSLVRAHDIMTVVTTLRLCVTVTRDTGSVLRPELSAQWKLIMFIWSRPIFYLSRWLLEPTLRVNLVLKAH